jgi:hypothetical protein
MELHLILEEEEALRPFLEGTTFKAISDLASAWQRSILEIESGYRLGIYDYNNDLDLREILQRVTDGSSGETREKLEAFLESSDASFSAATVFSPGPPFPGALRMNPAAWWYKVLPKKLAGELKRDAEKEGLLSQP